MEWGESHHGNGERQHQAGCDRQGFTVAESECVTVDEQQRGDEERHGVGPARVRIQTSNRISEVAGPVDQ